MKNDGIESKLAEYQRAYRKGTDWLLRQANPDGSIGPVAERLYYYRVPWALALVGEIAAANRKLDWIKNNMFTAEGAFEGTTPRAAFDFLYGSYPIACLLVGASMLQRLDIVYPGARRLLSWQDPVSGGFFNNRADMTATGEQVLFPACQAGMTALLLGRLEVARKAGTWVERLWQHQPDTATKLHHVYTPATGVVTDFTAEDAALYVTRKDHPWQYHYNGGIAAAFLTHLYLATGEASWLESARRYQDFSMTTDECQFQSMQTCKSGWGAGLLYVATREEAYRDWTVRMGDWFLEHQAEDGHWENTKFWTPNPTLGDNIELTTEFVMHVANITAYLSV